MDDLAAGLAGESASPEGTALTRADIDKIKAELSATYEERIKGFQRLLADRENRERALQAELEEIRSATLSPEERVQLREKQLATRVRELEAQIELERLGASYSDEMPIYRSLLEAKSAEEQLGVLRSIRAAAKPPVSEPPVTEGEDLDVADIDLNNPVRIAPAGATVEGQSMNDSLADKILASVQRMGAITHR